MTTTERTVRLNFEGQRARAELASFGNEVDQLIRKLGDISVGFTVEDDQIRSVAKIIEDLATVVPIGLDVDRGELGIAADEIAALADTIAVDIALDTGEVDRAAATLAGLQDVNLRIGADFTDIEQATTALDSIQDKNVRVGVDSSEIDQAVRRLDDLGNVSAKINVTTGDLDAAIRAAESFPDPIQTEIEVDDSALTKASGLIAGGALGAGVAQGFGDALDLGQVNDKVAAQLGLSTDAAELAGQVAADVYAGAWGDSVGEVGDAIASVGRNLVDVNEIGSAELQSLTTRSLDLASALDEDVGGVTKSVGQLVRTGLAKDFDEAFDIIATGITEGANRGEDLLDTFSEYGTSFQALGLDAGDALTILNQGLDAGADNTDRVADALREFRIRATDGTLQAIEGFDQLGLSADAVSAAIAQGGPAARQAFQDVNFALQGIEDPLERQRLAFQLYGSQVEDFGLDAGNAFAIYEDSIQDVAGAAEALGDTLNDNAAVKIEEFKRTTLLGVTEFVGGTLIPAFEAILPTVQTVFGAIGDVVGPFISQFIDSFTTLRAGFETGEFFGGGGIFDFMNRIGIGLGEIRDQAVLFFNALTTGFTEDEGTPIEALALFIRNDLLPTLKTLGEFFIDTVIPSVIEFAGTVGESLLPVLADVGGIIIEDLLPVLLDLATIFYENILPVLGEVAAFLLDKVIPVIVEVVGAVADFLGWLNDLNLLLPLLAGGLAIILGPFGLIGGAVIAVVTGLIQLYNRFELVRTIVGIVGDVLGFLWDILSGLVGIIWDVVTAVVDLVTPFDNVGTSVDIFTQILGTLAEVAGTVIGVVVDVITGGLDLIGGLFSGVGEAISTEWAAFWGGLTEVVTVVWDGLSSAVGTGLEFLTEAFSVATSVASEIWSGFWNGLTAVAAPIIDAIVGFVSDSWDRLTEGFRLAFIGIQFIWDSFWRGLDIVVSTVLGAITSIVETAISTVRDTIERITGRIAFEWDRFWARVQAIVARIWMTIRGVVGRAIEGVRDTISRVVGRIQFEWDRFWARIQAITARVWMTVRNTVGRAIEAVRSVISTVIGRIQYTWDRYWTRIQYTVARIWMNIKGVVGRAISGVSDTIGRVLSRIAETWGRIWGGIQDATVRVVQNIIDAVNRVLGPIGDAISALRNLASSVPGVSSISSGVSRFASRFFAEGGVVQPGDPTIGIFEGYGREVVLPEYATLEHIKGLLAQTNILDRLASDFSHQQRALFAQFNQDSTAERVTMTSPAGAGEPSHVDNSRHEYHFALTGAGESTGSKQLTAREVVAEIERRRRKPKRPGRWRSEL